MNALVADKMLLAKLLIFASAALVPQVRAAEQKTMKTKTPQSHRKTCTTIKGSKQTKNSTSAQGHCRCAMQHSTNRFRWLENSFCNPHFLQSHCDKAFSILRCDNVETLVMIWSRKGDPKVITGKPMYHSPAAIFTPIHEPSVLSKNKLLHFTVHWRETGLCVKQKFSW